MWRATSGRGVGLFDLGRDPGVGQGYSEDGGLGQFLVQCTVEPDFCQMQHHLRHLVPVQNSPCHPEFCPHPDGRERGDLLFNSIPYEVPVPWVESETESRNLPLRPDDQGSIGQVVVGRGGP